MNFGDRVFIRSSCPYNELESEPELITFPFLTPAWFLAFLTESDGSHKYVMVCIDHPTGVLPAGRVRRFKIENVMTMPHDILNVDWDKPPEAN